MTGFFEQNGYTTEQRRVLFFGVCIPIRLLLAYVIYAHSDKKSVLVLTMCISLLMGFTYISKHNSGDVVWWNRKIHAYIVFVIGLCALLLYSDVIHDKQILLALLVSDVLFGVYTHQNKKVC